MAIQPKGKKITGTKRKDKIVWKNQKIWKKNLTVNAAAGNDTIDFSKSPKNNTFIGGKGNDIIKTGKGEDTVIINKGDGNDTIYHNAKKTTILIKGAKAGDIKEFSKKGNNLILKYTHAGTKKYEKITLKNFFVLKNKNIYLKTTKIQKLLDLVNSTGIPIKSAKDNAAVTGSDVKDIITVTGDNNVINAGKGDDEIILNTSKATVKITNGSGNDTLALNKKAEDIRLVFDSDAAVSYTKRGNNLVITGKHANNIAESLTLINYFKGANQSDLYAKTYLVQGNNKNTLYDILNLGINNTYLTINGDANKNNKLSASFARNNTIIGGNYIDIMYGYKESTEENRLTTFITGAKGTSFIEGYGNEKYIVSSINSKTIINNFGNTISAYGNDTLQINGADIDDLYLYFDVSKDGFNDNKRLFVMNGNQLSLNLANNAFNNPYTKTWNSTGSEFASNIASFSAMAEGITLENYMYFYGDGYKYRMNNFLIADSNGNNAKSISALALDLTEYNSQEDAFKGVFKEISDKIKSYLTDKPYANTQELLLYINQNPNNADAKNMLNELTELYKSVKSGTNGDDTYSNLKNNSVYSGIGNDTFKMTKNFGEVTINADYIGENKMNTNTLVFNDRSFDDNSLYIDFEHFNNTEKDGEIFISDNSSANVLTYKGFFNDNASVNAKKLIIKDKNRSYNVSYGSDASTLEGNNIIYVKGETNVSLNNQYNIVYLNDAEAHTINFTGRHDSCISKGNSADIYNVNESSVTITDIQGSDTYNIGNNTEFFSRAKITDNNGNDTYNINLNDLTSVIISDTNGTDTMNIRYDASIVNVRLFFNVSKTTPSVEDDLFIFFDKSCLTFENIQNTDNFNGLKIVNHFKSEGNTIETIGFDAPYNVVNINSWIDNVKLNVASWLSGTQYDSVSDVLKSNNSEDILAVLQCFDKDYSYTFNS